MKVLVIGDNWPRNMQGMKRLAEEQGWDVTFQSLADRSIKGRDLSGVVFDEACYTEATHVKLSPYWRQGERW